MTLRVGDGGGRFPGWVGPVAIILVTTFAAWVLVSVALLIYTRDTRDPVVRVIEIPQGTNELIAAGENPLSIPSEWDMYADDTLVLRNHDDVDHRFGAWVVTAGTTREIVLQPILAGAFTCTLHPSGQVALNVEPRDYDWRQTAIPAALIGPTVGLIIIGSRRLLRLLALDADGEGAAGGDEPAPGRAELVAAQPSESERT